MGEGSRVAAGERIGDYRIELVLKRGDLWELAAAAHVVLPRVAVIRVAQPGLPSAGVQLLREACIVEALSHPGVPRLYDCGRLADRRPWIATERVIGRVLSEEISGGPMAPAQVAAMVRDIAGVLEHAHRRGVVHRAVRPQTIMITPASERGWPVCLCDWSEARTLDAVPAPRRTGPHDAPEVARGDVYDGAIDVFALGIVAYEAVTGTQLFEGAAPLTMVEDYVTRYLGVRGAATPACVRFAWLLDSMLAADPAHRPTAADVRNAAAQIAADLECESADTRALAAAMLALDDVSVEDIALISDGEIDAVIVEGDRTEPARIATMEVTPPPPPPPMPLAALGTVPPARGARGSGNHDTKAVIARLRRPRWTPSNFRLSSDQAKQISGEIDITARDPIDPVDES
jgi:eukaryotic-like serine/threonine-protein kinase